MEEKEFDYINMIPFIDVMLVLLTIVLMTSTFVVGGIIPVELPKVAGRQEKTPLAQVIEIDRRGVCHFRGRPLPLEELRRELSPMAKDTPFLIRADRTVQLQAFVEVLDAVKGSGFKKVGVQTEEVGP